MICPNCGKHTSHTDLCDHCGHATDFARRTRYLSVGTSENSVSIPLNAEPDPVLDLRHDTVSNNSRSATKGPLILLTGGIAILLVLCILFGIAFLRLSKELHQIQINSTVQTHLDNTENTDSTVISPTQVAPETQPESKPETTPSIPAPVLIEISFSVNPAEGMEACTEDLLPPRAIRLGETVSLLSEVSDPETGRDWKFLGWNTKKDGTGLFIYGEQIMDLPLAESITLYAQWEEVPLG